MRVIYCCNLGVQPGKVEPGDHPLLHSRLEFTFSCKKWYKRRRTVPMRTGLATVNWCSLLFTFCVDVLEDPCVCQECL